MVLLRLIVGARGRAGLHQCVPVRWWGQAVRAIVKAVYGRGDGGVEARRSEGTNERLSGSYVELGGRVEDSDGHGGRVKKKDMVCLSATCGLGKATTMSGLAPWALRLGPWALRRWRITATSHLFRRTTTEQRSNNEAYSFTLFMQGSSPLRLIARASALAAQARRPAKNCTCACACGDRRL